MSYTTSAHKLIILVRFTTNAHSVPSVPVCRGPEARLRHFLCSYPWAVRGARARGYEGVIPGIVCYFSPKRTATFFRAFANTGSVLAWACAFSANLRFLFFGTHLGWIFSNRNTFYVQKIQRP